MVLLLQLETYAAYMCSPIMLTGCCLSLEALTATQHALIMLSDWTQIYLWAPIYRENWSAFAPDFEELEENREYVEREDEFDINERPEDRALALEAATIAGWATCTGSFASGSLISVHAVSSVLHKSAVIMRVDRHKSHADGKSGQYKAPDHQIDSK